MLSHFAFAANAVFPILILILLGYLLRRFSFFNDEFLKICNKLVFYVLLPAMLFMSLYHVESISNIDWKAVLYAGGVIIFLFLAGIAIVAIFIRDRRQKGVVLQAVFRSNTALIGLPLAQALGGETGVALASVMSILAIPLFNILGVLVLSMYIGGEEEGPGEQQKIRWGQVFFKIVTNPLIIAIALGIIFLLLRAVIPKTDAGMPVFSFRDNLSWVYDAVEMISKTATPIALVVLGGNFRFEAVPGMKRQIIVGTAARLLLAPAIGLGCAVWLGHIGVLTLSAGHFAAMTSVFASPCAVASAVMAAQMDNDEQLATQLVVWTCTVSVLTVFLTVVLLRVLGFL